MPRPRKEKLPQDVAGAKRLGLEDGKSGVVPSYHNPYNDPNLSYEPWDVDACASAWRQGWNEGMGRKSISKDLPANPRVMQAAKDAADDAADRYISQNAGKDSFKVGRKAEAVRQQVLSQYLFVYNKARKDGEDEKAAMAEALSATRISMGPKSFAVRKMMLEGCPKALALKSVDLVLKGEPRRNLSVILSNQIGEAHGKPRFVTEDILDEFRARGLKVNQDPKGYLISGDYGILNSVLRQTRLNSFVSDRKESYKSKGGDFTCELCGAEAPGGEARCAGCAGKSKVNKDLVIALKGEHGKYWDGEKFGPRAKFYRTQIEAKQALGDAQGSLGSLGQAYIVGTEFA